jgi:uncharacterized cupredoxin-like copper-binding protein
MDPPTWDNRLMRWCLVAVIVLLSSACGTTSNNAGTETESSSTTLTEDGFRVVEVEMSDSKFNPNEFTVKVGESVTFRLHNVGALQHEAVIGDAAYQAKHAEMMKSMTSVPEVSMVPGIGLNVISRAHPGMGDPNAVTVAPGATGEVAFTFAKPTTLLIGCHEPGHYEAGMVATITVLPR